MNDLIIDRRIKKSKRALKEALISLMQIKEFKDITILNIVETADVNRGTFYRHYQDKEELFEDLYGEVIADLIDAYREPYKNTKIFDVATLTASSIKIFDHVLAYANFYKLIFTNISMHPYQMRIYELLKKLALEDLTTIFPNTKINKKLLTSYQTNALLGMIMEWTHTDFKYSCQYMSEQLLTFIQTTYSSPTKINILTE